MPKHPTPQLPKIPKFITPQKPTTNEQNVTWSPTASKLLPDLSDVLTEKLKQIQDTPAENKWFRKKLSAELKRKFVSILKREKFHFWKACQTMSLDWRTIVSHMQSDPDWKAAVEVAAMEFMQDIEKVNREMALKPHGVADRIFAMKHLLPGKYSDKANVIAIQTNIAWPDGKD